MASVRAEWPTDDLNPAADLAAWREGNALYDSRDDYPSMIRSGGLLCRALRHELNGTPILFGRDLPETVRRVLFSSAFPPPDQRSFPASVAAQLRLALTITRHRGWQPAAWGGDGLLGDFINASFMVLTMAIAPSPERLWEGDLKRFFTADPGGTMQVTLPVVAPSALDTDFDEAIATIHATRLEAKHGDPASGARLRGIAAAMIGDPQTALAAFEEAGQLGDVDAMFDAGNSARELGLRTQMLYWWEAAGDGGHGQALFSLGALAADEGRTDDAHAWFRRAAEAGEADGYAALTQLADDAGDGEAEFQWSRLGADAGQPFCQLRHGQLLLQRHPADRAVIPTQVVPLLTRAAAAEQDGALFLLGIAYGQVGDPANARLWLKRAEAAGDQEATRVMRENGLL